MSEAKKAYRKAEQDALELIDSLKSAITDFKGGDDSKVDWGYVGSIQHVKAELKEIAEFLGA